MTLRNAALLVCLNWLSAAAEFWMNLQMTYDLRNAEKALPARVRKYRRQQEHAGMMRNTDDGKSLSR